MCFCGGGGGFNKSSVCTLFIRGFHSYEHHLLTHQAREYERFLHLFNPLAYHLLFSPKSIQKSIQIFRNASKFISKYLIYIYIYIYIFNTRSLISEQFSSRNAETQHNAKFILEFEWKRKGDVESMCDTKQSTTIQTPTPMLQPKSNIRYVRLLKPPYFKKNSIM
jgi:hypothetical protein